MKRSTKNQPADL